MSGTRRDFLQQVGSVGGYRATYLTMQAMGLLSTAAMAEPQALVQAARSTRDRDDIVYVINGGGSTLPELEAEAAGLPNVRFVPMQPIERLPDVLAAADVHLGARCHAVDVPECTYPPLRWPR